MSDPAPFDAVILAGGSGSRLGGASKADLELDGQRLLDRVLVAVADAQEIAVVGDVDVPDGVHRTVEDPPRGGPVAGLAAGLAALEAAGSTAEWTLLASCDLANPLPALGRLLASWSFAVRSDEVTTDEHDGWCLADADDRPQWLLGIHRTSALRQGLERLGPPRDRSLRELFAEATLVTLPASRDDVADIDTWAELARWAERLEHPQEPASEPGQQEER